MVIGATVAVVIGATVVGRLVDSMLTFVDHISIGGWSLFFRRHIQTQTVNNRLKINDDASSYFLSLFMLGKITTRYRTVSVPTLIINNQNEIFNLNFQK